MGYHHKDENSCNNVADVSDQNFKVPVYSYVNGKDFCRAVKRCLESIDAENENKGHGCRRCGCRCNRRRKYF